MRHLLAVVLLAGALVWGAAAAEAAQPAARVLNGGNASRNLQLAVTLPPALAAQPFSSADIAVALRPAVGAPADGLKASGVFQWRLGSSLFLDAREMPELRPDAGGYTAWVTLKTPEKTYTVRAEGDVRPVPEHTDVVLLVDSSLSMHRNDPEKKRVAAARAFWELAGRDGRIARAGIVSFNELPKTLLPLTPLSGGAAETAAAALKKINAEGRTNIGKALERAVALLEKSPRAAVVLLTDGRNESVEYAGEHLRLRSRHIPVYAVGLSAQADQELLRLIAGETGGKSYWTADSRELTSLYLDIAAEIGNSAPVLRAPLTAGAEVNLPVDGSIKELCLVADNPEARWELVPPAPAAAPREYLGSEFRELRVDAPAAGVWKVKVAENSPAARLTVTARTRFFLDAFPPVVSGKGRVLGAVLADGARAAGGARLTARAGGKDFTLYDDGRHLDGAAGDGVYAAAAPGDAAGALLVAEDPEGKIFRREAESRHWRKLGGFVLAEQLWARAAADCGTVLPGAEAEVKAEFDFHSAGAETAVRFLPCTLRDADGKTLKLSSVRYPRGFAFRPGANTLPLRFPIAADQAPGVFTGTLPARAGKLEFSLPLKITVRPPVLAFTQTEFACGWQRPGAEIALEIPVKYDGALPLKLTPACRDGRLRPVDGEITLAPGARALALRLRVAADNGFYSDTVEFSGCSWATPAAAVGFAVAPRGAETPGTWYGHELVPLAAGEKTTVALPGHEFLPRVPTVEKVAAAYTHELRLSYTVPAPMPAAESEQPGNRGVWIALAVFGGIVILLLLRRTAESRMWRFALLSAVIHLPIIGFLALYFAVPEKTAPLTSKIAAAPLVVRAAAASAENSEPAAGAAENAETAALERRVLRTEAFLPESGAALAAMAKTAPAAPGESARAALPAALPDLTAEYSVELPEPAAENPATPAPLTRTPARAAVAAVEMPLPAVAPLALPELAEKALPAARAETAVPARGARAESGLAEVVKTAPAVTASPLNLPAARAEDACGDFALPAVGGLPVSEKTLAENPLARAETREAAAPAPGRALPEVSPRALPEITFPAAEPEIPAASKPMPVPAGRMVLPENVAAETLRLDPAAHPEDTITLPPERLETVTLADEISLPTARVERPVTSAPTLPAALPMAPAPRLTLPETPAPAARPSDALAEKRGFPVTTALPMPSAEKMPALAAGARTPTPSAGNLALPAHDGGLLPIPGTESRAGLRRSAALVAAVSARALPAAPETEILAAESAAVAASAASAGDNDEASLPRDGKSALALAGVAPAVSAGAAVALPGARAAVDEMSLALGEISGETLPAAMAAPLEKPASAAVTAVSGWNVQLRDVSFSVGLAGAATDQAAVAGFLRSQGVEPAQVALTAAELGGCGVVLVAEKIGFTGREGQEMRRYLDRGGRLWFHRCHGFPPAVRAGGEVLPAAGGLFPQAAGAVVLRLGGKVVAVADEGADRAGLPAVLNLLADRELFVPAAAAAAGAELWQDFSAAVMSGWAGEKWGNPVTLSRSDDGTGGGALRVRVAPGAATRAAVSFTVPDAAGRRMDVGGARAQYADVFNAGNSEVKVSLSLTNQTGSGWDEFETAPVELRPGWNRNVRFVLSGMRSRRAESSPDPRVRRGYIYGLHGGKACAKVTYYFHTAAAGEFLLDNLRWEK